MRVVTTNLAIRFYAEDGWTLEDLLPLICNVVRVNESCFLYFDDGRPYWVPAVGVNVNIPKLLTLVTKVDRTFNDFPGETDERHLERFNW